MIYVNIKEFQESQFSLKTNIPSSNDPERSLNNRAALIIEGNFRPY